MKNNPESRFDMLSFICAFFGAITGEFIYDIIKRRYNSHNF